MLRHKLVPVRKRTGTLSRDSNFSNGIRSSIYEAIARAAREARLGDDGIVHPRSWLIASSSVDWFLLERSLRNRFANLDWITTGELSEWLGDKSRQPPILLDVPTSAEWNISHSPGAQLVDPKASAGLDCAHDFKTCADRNLLRSRLSLRWTSNFRATLDTALVSASAVYDQATNTMIVFGGIDAIGLAFGDTNAVLLYA